MKLINFEKTYTVQYTTGLVYYPHNVTAEQVTADIAGSTEQTLVDAKSYIDSKIENIVIKDDITNLNYVIKVENGVLVLHKYS